MAVRKPQDGGLKCFPPVADRDAKILILGSMPGKASLGANEYYAHKRNQFWPIMGELFGATPDLPYEQRLAKLKQSGIALWDVIERCERRTSLDSDIKNEIPNDLETFLQACSGIDLICFNGKKAESSLHGHFPVLIAAARHRFALLPSTSPAHAGMTFEMKLERWKAVIIPPP